MKVKTLLPILVLALTANALSQTIPDAPEAKTEHRFLDRTNSLLMGASAASLAADGWSSRSMLARGIQEANPIARPFVGSTGGNLLYFGGSQAGVVSGMYWLHRLGHHKLEKVLPIAVSGLETWCAIHNSRLHWIR
jgi:hypothetical protein